MLSRCWCFDSHPAPSLSASHQLCVSTSVHLYKFMSVKTCTRALPECVWVCVWLCSRVKQWSGCQVCLTFYLPLGSLSAGSTAAHYIFLQLLHSFFFSFFSFFSFLIFSLCRCVSYSHFDSLLHYLICSGLSSSPMTILPFCSEFFFFTSALADSSNTKIWVTINWKQERRRSSWRQEVSGLGRGAPEMLRCTNEELERRRERNSGGRNADGWKDKSVWQRKRKRNNKVLRHQSVFSTTVTCYLHADLIRFMNHNCLCTVLTI